MVINRQLKGNFGQDSRNVLGITTHSLPSLFFEAHDGLQLTVHCIIICIFN